MLLNHICSSYSSRRTLQGKLIQTFFKLPNTWKLGVQFPYNDEELINSCRTETTLLLLNLRFVNWLQSPCQHPCETGLFPKAPKAPLLNFKWHWRGLLPLTARAFCISSTPQQAHNCLSFLTIPWYALPGRWVKLGTSLETRPCLGQRGVWVQEIWDLCSWYLIEVNT